MTAAPRPVVIDASPLISLSRIGLLPLIGQLFPLVLVPAAVVKEVGPQLALLPSLVPAAPRSIDARILAAGLGPGEPEAIALGLEHSARFVILDDRSGRQLARNLGVPMTGTVGVLIEAKRLGHLPVVRPNLDALLASGFHLSRQVYDDVLLAAGELP